MSTLQVGTIKSASSAAPVFQNSSGTEKGQIVKAWINFNGTGTIAIRDSFNISSITDHGTGEYSVTFSNAFSNNDYCAVADAGGTSGIPTTKITTTDEADFFTTKIQYQVLSTVSNGAMDNNINTIIFIGDN